MLIVSVFPRKRFRTEIFDFFLKVTMAKTGVNNVFYVLSFNLGLLKFNSFYYTVPGKIERFLL